MAVPHWFLEHIGNFFQAIQSHEGPRFQQLVAEIEGLDGTCGWWGSK